MRLVPGFLLLSLAVNCVLTVFWLRKPERISSVPAALQTASEERVSGSALAKSLLERSGIPIQLWHRLHEEDLQITVNRMRAAGFPQRELGAIVAEVVLERESLRRAALERRREQPSYWRNGYDDVEDAETFMELERQMAADRAVARSLSVSTRNEVFDLLTFVKVDPPTGHLPVAKREVLNRITNDYSELKRTVLASAGPPGPEVHKKIRLLELEYERDVRAALTPEEYEAHQMKVGPTAHQLRNHLDPFQPTEEEFKALHGFHESIRLDFVGMPEDEATRLAQRQALETMWPQIEATLGYERFADYQQALRENARNVNRLLVHLELPLRIGGRIEETRQDILRSAEAVQADPALAPSERSLRMAGLAQEARSRLSALWGGDRNLGAYEEMESWIRDLQPRAAP